MSGKKAVNKKVKRDSAKDILKAFMNGSSDMNIHMYPGGLVGITDFGTAETGESTVVGNGNGLITKYYSRRDIDGDVNDKSKIEAIQCMRCEKWIPLQALVDYENGKNKKNKVHTCAVGRTGNGGIHMYDFAYAGRIKYSTKMLPPEQVEKYVVRKRVKK